jgi:hypothetical protein
MTERRKEMLAETYIQSGFHQWHKKKSSPRDATPCGLSDLALFSVELVLFSVLLRRIPPVPTT